MATPPRVFELSEDQYLEMIEGSGGFCLACGAEAGGVEPDAQRYKCESCGERRVYGIEQLLIMGRVQLQEDEDGLL